MKYQPPFEYGVTPASPGIHSDDADAAYVNGDPATGTEGSIPPAEAFEHTMREIVHLIEDAGLDPDHEDLEQLRKGVEEIIKRSVASVGGGAHALVGYDTDDKQFYVKSLTAGANITITPVESPAASGKYRLVIAATGGGEGGGPLENVGDGTGEVYKGTDGSGNEEIRTLKGLSGISITTSGDVVEISAAGGGDAMLPEFIILQERAGNVAATAMSASVPIGRVLNTIKRNTIAGASLSAGQVVLPAGKYRAHFHGASSGSPNHQSQLYDVTNALLIASGISVDATAGGTNVSPGIATFTLAGTTTIELRHINWVSTSADERAGDESNIGANVHVDAMVHFIKYG